MLLRLTEELRGPALGLCCAEARAHLGLDWTGGGLTARVEAEQLSLR